MHALYPERFGFGWDKRPQKKTAPLHHPSQIFRSWVWLSHRGTEVLASTALFPLVPYYSSFGIRIPRVTISMQVVIGQEK